MNKDRMISASVDVISEAIRLKFPEFGMLSDSGSGEFSNDVFFMRSFTWDDGDANFSYMDDQGRTIRVYWRQDARRVTMVEGDRWEDIDFPLMVASCLGSIWLD